ncbi:deoxyribonuclease IV [archaeon]|nr:MAG: deoxyribonuclease IV [archaeon]
MKRIGAHVSIAGGVSNAIGRQREVGGNAGQIFSSSPRTWKAEAPSREEASRFKSLRTEADQRPYVVHGTYLINLGTKNDDVYERSLDALQTELDITGQLGIEYYVFHPGAATGGWGADEGISRVAEGLDRLEIPEGTTLLLEDTAGKGSTLGRTFSELNEMVERSGHGLGRIGICFDTCHAFCAGYPIHTERGLADTLDELDDAVGLKHLHIVHLNDSKHPFDSRKDEHAHIGMGEIGEDAFRRIVNEPRLGNVPFILETPVTEERGYAWNIAKVRSLMEGE